MLRTHEVNQIVEIIQKAIERMEEDGHKEYYLKFVKWKDDWDAWAVGFYTEYGTFDTPIVCVQGKHENYMATGKSYE